MKNKLLRRFAAMPCIFFAGLCSSAAGQAQQANFTGVVFKTDSALSSLSEMIRRLRSPRAAAKIKREAADAGQSLDGQVLDISAERFAIYVPPTRPTRGYGVLVFVPPWQDARLPPGWKAIFDREGIIFVTAEKSGNAENAFGRRMPLAVLAAHNVMSEYAVNTDRVFIGGFSGGARVALRLALAYPDVFRGAFLNAGSDLVGNADISLPPRDLLYAVQKSSRLFFATGAQDTDQVTQDADSVRMLKRWCVTMTSNFATPQTAHEVAPALALQRALAFLDNNIEVDQTALLACRSRLDHELKTELDKARRLQAAGQDEKAQRAFVHIDEKFGGLADTSALTDAPLDLFSGSNTSKMLVRF